MQLNRPTILALTAMLLCQGAAGAAKLVAEIPLSPDGQYQTGLQINGKHVVGLIDTGANRMALNRQLADFLELSYATEPYALVATAGGVVRGYPVVIPAVTLHGVTVPQVDAIVLEDDSLMELLIGMSLLQRFEMRYANNRLKLYHYQGRSPVRRRKAEPANSDAKRYGY